MNCLCCGKPIIGLYDDELQTQWHGKCISNFFGTKDLPFFDLSEIAIEKLALESVNRGFTVTGVQKKLSLHLSSERGKRSRLTIVGYPLGYILKPPTHEYAYLPESEYLVMQMARVVGIKTVPFALVRLADNNKFAYITKRIDRTSAGEKLAMEDFCQLDSRSAADKYKGSYERCGKIISTFATNPSLDMAEFYLRLLFSFVVGNSDMHLKNFSLIETSFGSGQYYLSDAYDMLPVNVILPQDMDEMALTLNGKKRNLGRKDFILLAENLKLNKTVYIRLLERIVSLEKTYLEMCKNSYMSEDYIDRLCSLISRRIASLKEK